MSILGTLGAISAGVALVAATCKSIREIMEEVNNTMGEVDELMGRLNAESDGSFKDNLVDACNWLKDRVDDMMRALTSMVEAVEEAMKENEKTDNDGAALLKEARR